MHWLFPDKILLSSCLCLINFLELTTKWKTKSQCALRDSVALLLKNDYLPVMDMDYMNERNYQKTELIMR